MTDPRPLVKPAATAASSSPSPEAIGPEAYARWRATTLGGVTEALEQRLLHQLVGMVKGKRVLDLGCGDGLLTCALAGHGAYAVGIDADRRMLVAAQSRAARPDSRRAFVEGRVEYLPFPDGVFDVVVAVTVLCFVSNSSLGVQEAVRVLRPGGRLVIGELGRWNVWAARRRIRVWLGSELWKGARFRTAGELRSLLERAGIDVAVVRGAVYYPPVGWMARILAPADRWFGAVTTIGAAFIGVAGSKNRSSRTALSQTASGLESVTDPEL